MIKIQPLFASFVAAETLSIDNELIKKYLYDLEKKDSEGRIISNVGGWQSQPLDLEEPKLKNFFDTVTYYFNEVAISLGFPKKEYTLNNVWANINRKNNYNSIHYHPGCFLSGVYYVDGGDNKGQLKFRNPIQYIDSFYENHIEGFNEFNSCDWTMPCDTGSLLIFPAWLYHHVTPNLTDEDRISIAFNVCK